MALQMRGADKRLYNPDRDLLWALPRILRSALRMIGEDITTDHVRGMMKERCIECPVPDENIREEMQEFLTEMAQFLNAMKDDPTVRGNPKPRFKKLFADGPRGGIRALIADLIFTVMVAELPIWFDSVQPEKDGCIPRVDEVQRAVEALLDGGNDGKVGTDE